MQKSLAKWFLYNLIGKFTPPLLSLLIIPELIELLGKKSFGEFALLMTTLLILNICDFGISKALVKDIACQREDLQDRNQSYASVYWSSYLFQLTIGLLGTSSLLAIALLSDWRENATLIDLHSPLHIALAGTFLPIIIASGVSRAFLEGKNNFKSLNLIRAGFSFAVYASPLIVIKLLDNPSIVILSALGIRALESALLTVYVCLKEHLNRKSELSIRYVRLLLPFGIWVMLSNTLSPIITYGERFVAASTNGLSSFSDYFIAIEIITKPLIIVSALATATFSIESKLNKSNTADQSIGNIRYIVAFFYITLAVLLNFEIDSLAQLWIGPEHSGQLGPLVRILSLGLVFNAVAYTLLNHVYAAGNSRKIFFNYLIQLPLYLSAVYLAALHWGPKGVAFAWSARVIVDFLIMWQLASRSNASNARQSLAKFIAFCAASALLTYALFLPASSLSLPLKGAVYGLYLPLVFSLAMLYRHRSAKLLSQHA